MRCDEVRNMLLAAGAGSPPPEVSRHVATCDACAGFAERHRRIAAGLRAFATPPASADPLRDLLARLDAQPDGTSSRDRKVGSARLSWSALLSNRALRIGWWGAVAALSAAHVVIGAWPSLLETAGGGANSFARAGASPHAESSFESAALCPHARRGALPEDLRLERVAPVMSRELEADSPGSSRRDEANDR